MTTPMKDVRKRLQQWICQMEETVAEMSSRTASLAARERRLVAEMESARRLGEKWSLRVMKAMEIGDDQLARDALAQKEAYEKRVADSEELIRSTRENYALLARRIEELDAKLVRAKRRLETISRQEHPADH